MSDVKYPQVKVKLIGEDSNAFSILGRVNRAMKEAGVPEEEIKKFGEEARSGDYGHLLCTVMDWVTTDEEGEEEDPELCQDCCLPLDECECDEDDEEDDWEEN